MIAFIDDHRDVYGVEPICRVLPIAPSTYHERVAQRRDPMRLSARAQQDQTLKPEIARVFAENFGLRCPQSMAADDAGRSSHRTLYRRAADA